ncbi:hypothetical protein BT63DRAFT_225662 [Microthyrium microscopicum]|uniref:Glycine zipper 2TM domain-containing protein n=1 Tax=Microthyrium microscopicum TaxID=703497 RepID=A0A6A6UE88_9PEZI|nr:hypothetical protein BT63DRAFT_225662 [Microthyrium microscopicum]
MTSASTFPTASTIPFTPSTSSTPRNPSAIDNDTYSPSHPGFRNLAASDGYEAGDGYDHIYPQLSGSRRHNSTMSGSNRYGAGDGYSRENDSRYGDTGDGSNGYGPRTDAYAQSRAQISSRGQGGEYEPRRRSSADYERRGGGRERTYVRSDGRDVRRDRAYEYDTPSSSDEEDERPPRPRENHSRGRERSQGEKSQGRLSRSRSRVKQKISQIFGKDEHHDGEGNSDAKKWVATLAGAAAGGLAARQVKKDHWVPAAIGAIVGGLTAREAEKGSEN